LRHLSVTLFEINLFHIIDPQKTPYLCLVQKRGVGRR